MDSTGITPLHLACHYGQLDCVQLLLNKSANVNILGTVHNM